MCTNTAFFKGRLPDRETYTEYLQSDVLMFKLISNIISIRKTTIEVTYHKHLLKSDLYSILCTFLIVHMPDILVC